jgi:predicted O-methyltransferase YrrM
VNSYRTNLKQKYPDCWKWISLARRIPGPLTENEANLLFLLARTRTPSIDPLIVELGARRGKASLLLAAGLGGKTSPRLFCIQRTGETAGELDRQELRRNLQRCHLAHIVDTTLGYSCDASANWKDCIDILFINATRDDATLRSDVLLWSPFVKLGGLVVLHGVSPELPAPCRAMAENLQAPKYSDLRHVDSLAWAVKRSAASFAIPAANAGAQVDSNPRQQELEWLTRDLARLRYLLNRSIEAMLHLNTIPAVPEQQGSHRDARREPLEDATEMAMARLQDYVRRAAKELAENRHAIQSLRRSWSWRLTAPLRLGIETLYAIAGLLTSFGHGSPKARIVGLAQWMLFGRQLRASGLLDERYYQGNYPDVAWARTSPVLHFLVCGASEGKNPNELFEVDYYLRSYADVADSGVNPLIHYLRNGAYEGRDPHPYFDSSFYLEQNPDVRESRLNPLAHYLAPGIAEGRDPNPWFDTSEYLEQNPDVATFGLNPLGRQTEVWSKHRACSQL